jgi:hypothetical protein
MRREQPGAPEVRHSYWRRSANDSSTPERRLMSYLLHRARAGG